MGRLGLGRDHDAGRVLVEAMHDAGTRDPADAGEFGPAVKQQGVDQRTAFGTAGRVDDEAGLLVDDDEVLVLEDDIEGDVLGLWQGVDRGGQVDGVGGSGDHLGAGVGGRLAIDRDPAFLDQDAQAGAGHAGSSLRQPFIQARACGFRRGGQGKGGGIVRSHAFVAMRCKVGIQID